MRVKLKDIEFSSPLLTASGTYGYGHEVRDIADVNQWGGIITKSVTRHPREGNPSPRIAETRSGMINSIGLANLGVEKYCNEIIPLLNELQTKVIINIAGSAMKDYLETMEMLESKNGKHVGYEINISCPNVKEGGIEFGVNCEMTEQLTIEMRKRTDKLLIMKLSPNVTRIEDIAQAAESGGADAVSAINTVVGMAIDLKTRRPKLNTTFGGLSGPAIKPIAIANVHKVFKAVNIPIIGIGGIATAKDVVEFLLAGATMVQIGTMNYQNPNLGVQLKGELSEYYSQNEIEKTEDLIGKVEYHSN
ncbi:MAG TPA: dihydroorotate dehydrogenase [Candidatus Marinimicrobia bacterium]|jgi:dihydroorotate dehydrogenase (NAD+) catalytic subunit|nr:dihydroorotate dehydrogenase [Candidatus Neomarinimicrobiota bacterium]